MLAVYVLGENTVMYEPKNISSTKTKRNFHFFVLKSKEYCLFVIFDMKPACIRFQLHNFVKFIPASGGSMTLILSDIDSHK